MYEFIRMISHDDQTIIKKVYLYRNTKNNKLYLSYEKPYITTDLLSKYYENIGIKYKLTQQDIKNRRIDCFNATFLL